MKNPQDEVDAGLKHRTGESIEAQSVLNFPSEKKAEEFFETVKHRLQDVNHWDKMAGGMETHFQLVNKEGCEVRRPVQKGDYLKIDIPAEKPEPGRTYDWVKVEDVKVNASDVDESFGFKIRPTVNPFTNRKDMLEVPDESVSLFTVARKGSQVVAAIYDRSASKKSFKNKIKDTVSGAVGLLTFSRIHWKNLTDGLLTRPGY